MNFRYSVQVLFPFVNVSKKKPKRVEIISQDASGFKFIELRAMSGFKAYRKREKDGSYEFLTEGKQIVIVHKSFCLITEIKETD